ncbi:hypothetical protein HanRHA438_Chr11g0493471 [Helianthus annuus]|nr:hypothetical protein HanRHA438_Chr11g0493471 [Helianthus annuus]
MLNIELEQSTYKHQLLLIPVSKIGPKVSFLLHAPNSTIGMKKRPPLKDGKPLHTFKPPSQRLVRSLCSITKKSPRDLRHNNRWQAT